MNKLYESNSLKLVSLLDILKHDAQAFVLLMGSLHYMQGTLQFEDISAPLPEELIPNIQKTVNTIADQCKKLKLNSALKVINYIANNFTESKCGQLCQSLSILKDIIHEELGEHVFLIIPQERAIWLNKQDAFGQNVSEKFNSAQGDIIEAGSCYAVGLYTACVFHLMRVLEHGLGALAKDVNLKFYRQSWGVIINKIQDKIDEEIKSLNKLQKEPVRTERLTFLSQTAKEFVYFKDGWRNYAMHGLKEYDGPKALSILNHVKTFMALLATRLIE